MDQIKTGKLIRFLRQKQGMTQLELAEKIGVSDKAVSKWERGCGAPEISLLPCVSETLHVDTKALLRGDLEENGVTNGNMKKTDFYVCPDCGNLVFSTDPADINCCGKKLAPMQPQKADAAHRLTVENSDGEWYITSNHAMRREHYISFLAFQTGDMLLVKKQYPEWGLEVRMPRVSHGRLLWYCTQHGLYMQDI